MPGLCAWVLKRTLFRPLGPQGAIVFSFINLVPTVCLLHCREAWGKSTGSNKFLTSACARNQCQVPPFWVVPVPRHSIKIFAWVPKKPMFRLAPMHKYRTWASSLKGAIVKYSHGKILLVRLANIPRGLHLKGKYHGVFVIFCQK